MKKPSTRVRTLSLVFAPLLLGTITVPAARPARIVASERAGVARLTRGRAIDRTK